MKLLFVSLMVTTFGPSAHALEVMIGKPDQPAAHRCEIQTMEIETRYQNQPNRVVLNLREPRSAAYHSCPTSVAITVDSRGEAMKLFEVIRAASETTCLITDVVTAKHNKKSCDAGFNVKMKM